MAVTASLAPRVNALGLAFGGLIAMASAMGIGRFVYTPILPFMLADLGLSAGAAGLIASANFIGYLAGALLAATPFLGGSRRAWLIGSLSVSAASTAAMGGVSDVMAMMVLRFAGGVASALVLIFASSLVLDRLRSHGRAGLAALHFGGVGAGIAASAVLVTALAHAGFDWRAQWFGCGALSLIAIGAVLWLVPDESEPPPAAAGAAGNGKRGFTALAIAYGLFGFGYVITATFIVVITRGSPAIRPLEPVIWLIVGAAAVPSVAIWTTIGQRIGIAAAYGLAALVLAAGVVASVIWLTATGIVVAATLLGGTFMGLTALGIAGARLLAPGDQRRAVAVMTAAFGLGQIIGPIVAGRLVDLTGSFMTPSLLAAACLVIAAGLSFAVQAMQRG